MEINFIKEYIIHPRTVGAILPSSSRLARKMIKNINFDICSCIVEYGPGTGVFTDEILKNRKEDTIFILLEYNRDFYELLKEKYKGEKNMYIINDSAEKVKYYLEKYSIKKVEYIVSGLPFASLPQSMSSQILKESKEILDKEGKFITFQYTKFKENTFKKYFKNVNYNREMINIPPAYVFTCEN